MVHAGLIRASSGLKLEERAPIRTPGQLHDTAQLRVGLSEPRGKRIGLSDMTIVKLFLLRRGPT